MLFLLEISTIENYYTDTQIPEIFNYQANGLPRHFFRAWLECQTFPL
jgi:hypothetical protein